MVNIMLIYYIYIHIYGSYMVKPCQVDSWWDGSQVRRTMEFLRQSPKISSFPGAKCPQPLLEVHIFQVTLSAWLA